MRGIFEDWTLPGSSPPRVCVVGMAGLLENAVDVLRLDRQGSLWQPEEEDPTLDRRARCHAPRLLGGLVLGCKYKLEGSSVGSMRFEDFLAVYMRWLSCAWTARAGCGN